MQGLMQDAPLTLPQLLWRLERLFHRKEVVSLREHGVHRYTYGELVTRVHRLAAALRRLGVRPGDRVATLAWSNYRHLELYYAVPCMGAVVHTLNLRLHPDQLEFIVKDAGDRVVVVDASLLPVLAKLAGRMPTVEHVVVMADPGAVVPQAPFALLDYEELLAAEGDVRYPWPAMDERDAAAMCYTSGTTGMPKGVLYSHRSNLLHAMVSGMTGGLNVQESSAVLAVVPMFHANCWGLPYAVAITGARMLLPDRFMGDPPSLYRLASEEKATILAGVPTVWLNFARYLDSIDGRLPSVESVLCGGAAVPRALMEAMDRRGLRIVHAWGMTETSPIGTLGNLRSWHAPEDEMRLRLTQGAPAPLVELRIADLVTGAELPWDGVAFGEIEVHGPWVASGYWNGADAERFTADGWFKTGDVASVDPDGFVSIVDRAKDVIKSGGEWISSVELENALMSHPAVLEAAVVGLAHPTWQERPVAYVVAKPDARGTLTSDDLRAFLKERVASWWVPDEIRFLDEVPKTSVGKFDKKALRAGAEPLRPVA